MPSSDSSPAVDEPVVVPERKIIPAVRTLNSKLTGRRAVRPSAPPVEDLEEEGESSGDDSYTTYTNSENGSVPGTSRSNNVSSVVTKKGEDKGVVNVQNMGNNRVKHWGKYLKRVQCGARCALHGSMGLLR